MGEAYRIAKEEMAEENQAHPRAARAHAGGLKGIEQVFINGTRKSGCRTT
jgi:hypothetical protein